MSNATITLLYSKKKEIAEACQEAKRNNINLNQLYNVLFGEYDKNIYSTYMNHMVQDGGIDFLRSNGFDVTQTEYQGKDVYWIKHLDEEVIRTRKFRAAMEEVEGAHRTAQEALKQTKQTKLALLIDMFLKSDPEALSVAEEYAEQEKSLRSATHEKVSALCDEHEIDDALKHFSLHPYDVKS